MSIIKANGAGEVSTGLYNGVATQSLRFDDGSNPALAFTPSSASSATDRRKVTHSFWVKRATLGAYQSLYSGNRASGGDYYNVGFTDGDAIRVILDVDSGGYGYTTDAVFRDTASWYNIVCIIDTTQGTDTNRVKIYSNGVLQTTTTTYSGGHVAQNFSTYVMDGNEDEIGRFAYNDSSNFDGYMSEVILTIGQDNTISQFGETKNGVWIPIAYTGSYGANGVRLQFSQVGVGTASTSTIGADTSGNTNHWTSTGIVASDCNMPDSPENNFSTLNNRIREYSGSYQDKGMLRYIMGSSGVTTTAFSSAVVNQNLGGKWYAEVRINDYDTGSMWVGVSRNVPLAAGGLYTGGTRFAGYAYKTDGNKTTTDNNGSSYGNSYGTGNVIGIALDLDNDAIYFYKDGTIQNSGTAAFTSITSNHGAYNSTDTGNGDFIFGVDGDGGNSATFNFGQDSTFAGTETAGGNSDSNGIGDFHTAVPSGYLAVCSANMVETTIGPISDTLPTQNFNTVIYTGNGGTLSVSGFNHQPDFLWIKSRNIAGNHRLQDSTRGVSFSVITNASDAEKGDSDAEDIDSFDSDGFTVTQATYDDFNDASDTYVAWSWKANGGSTSTNNDGAIQSTVQANTAAGFSIVTYTGSGSASTVGHGLGGVPEVMIIKNRSGGHSWAGFYHHRMAVTAAASATDYLSLNGTSALVDDSTIWNDTAPTSTVFTVGTASNTGSSANFIGYFFRSITGYSRCGSYLGNSQNDGSFIYLGFRPTWVLIKTASSSGDNWYVADDKRDNDGNPMKQILNPNRNAAEYTTGSNKIDFYSNGFKCLDSGSGDTNINGETFIYIAFAKNPFKYANAK